MKRIALKIDVGTYRGTRFGVPALIDCLQKHDAQASFFFSLGLDQSGQENRKNSLKRFYDLRTRLYGSVLPSRDIGKHCADTLRQVRDAGFEVGIHAWNRSDWEKRIEHAENPWVETQLKKACTRFAEIFSETANAHAAAGWRSNRHALRLTQRLGFSYASDCRGTQPFIPVINGEIVACPQIPTTLPTLDEILSIEHTANPAFTPEHAAEHIAKFSTAVEGDHVFTLRAELEGMKFINAFDQLLKTWKTQGYQLIALRDLHATLEIKDLPRHIIEFKETPGRTGLRMTQGDVFLRA